jgi:sugar/nucleoside kinase (ribokinase family)
MENKKIRVTGIGNAIVDVIAGVSEEFLTECRLHKGSMRLICEEEAAYLHSKITVKKTISGGSVANTIAGLAVLNNKVAFIGKVSEDELGKVFESELKKLHIAYTTKKAGCNFPPTASCIVLTTPDAQRTLNTCIGIAGMLMPEDIDEKLIKDSEIIYIEGYLFYQVNAYGAVKKAVNDALKYKSKIALTLSDVFCVEMHRDKFIDLINLKTDILFANEDEIKMLFKAKNFKEAVNLCSDLNTVCALTRGSEGSVIVSGKDIIEVEAEKVAIIDSTGAGDMYAAGFLNGYLQKKDLLTCAKMGNIVAGDIVKQYGARADKDLIALLSSKGL